MDFLISQNYVKNAPKSEFELDLLDILERIKSYYPEFSEIEIIKIKHAFYFAEQAHKGQKRKSGLPYFIHPIEATKILLTIKPDILTICACLLHDVVEDTPITLTEIRENFGERITFFCQGVEKITKVRLENESERQYESLRKLFVSMAEDIRVIFIKLADRLHNLSTLEALPRKSQIRIAKESMEISAPIAGKLGLSAFKNQMEDLCFKFLHTDIYNDLIIQIDTSIKKQNKYLKKGKKILLKILKSENIEVVKIEGRNKHLYSIYQKMKRKNFSTVAEIYDLIALRIILKNQSDCYRTLGIIHTHWKPIMSRFKDYIAVPKNNGYKSLHLTILGFADNPVPTEIQIRTQAMHLDAEFGPAAHWAYKQTKSSSFNKDYLKKFDWISRKILEANKQKSGEEFFIELSKKMSKTRIHVFTPKGDVKDLKIGSTPVDLAYAVHSEIGDTCIGATVNGIIKPLNYELKTGDVVLILTKKGRKPNPLWLKFVKSSNAKSHIKTYVNSIKDDSYEFDIHPNTQKIVDKFDEKKSIKLIKKSKTTSALKSKKIKICIGGEANIPFKLAACCKPKIGEPIVAYNSRGLEFSIHKQNCPHLIELEEARFLDANFIKEFSFHVHADERKGLLTSLSEVITDLDMNILDASLDQHNNQKKAIWKFIIETSSKTRFLELLEKLEKVPNVLKVIDNTKY